MSDDNERLFCSGRNIITHLRTSLLSDVIEACQCLKSWYQGDKDGDNKVFDNKADI